MLPAPKISPQRKFLHLWYFTLLDGFLGVCVDPSPVPSPSSSPSPSTTEPTEEDDDTLLYIIVGAVGGAVLAALVFLLLIILIIACCRVKVNRQGFYVTDEDKGDAPQMLRYSASLRSISSQTVVPVDTRDKENEYMV